MTDATFNMGIVSTGMYLPETVMTAEEISEESGLPLWVVKEKLGINQKHVPTPGIHPNAMAVEAGKQAIGKAGIDPKEIDVLLCTTEEWKEYNLWTAGIDLAYELGATNAWGMDLHMRCATTIAALKLWQEAVGEKKLKDKLLAKVAEKLSARQRAWRAEAASGRRKHG